MHVGPAHDPPPRPPVEPDAADCCGEGCANCVFDVYDTALERYRMALQAWQARQVPEPDCGGPAPPPDATVSDREPR